MGRGITLAALVLASALSGCGGGRTPPNREGAAEAFAADCGACHSLIGNESLRRQGGDLLGYRLSRQVLLAFAREMPVAKPLTSRELADVVDYVLEVERGARAR
jgi:hypothetical protein